MCQNKELKKKLFKKKKLEYLNNYQYHEIKNIKNPNTKRVSIVNHKRLGDIIGGDNPRQDSRLLSSQTMKIRESEKP